MIIHVQQIDYAFLKVTADPSVERELSDYFSFEVPGYKFMPAYRSGRWDGRIRLYDIRQKTLHFGHLERLKEFARTHNHTLMNDVPDQGVTVNRDMAIQGLKNIKLKNGITPRDYQIEAVYKALNDRRLTLLSPTASGKSLMIYLLHQYVKYAKTLLIVPTVNLVNQMEADFRDYGFEGKIHKIMEGSEKESDAPLIIATWQSIYKMPKSYFEQFHMVIGDEVHKFKAASLVSIMEKLSLAWLRFGFTGTLDDTKVHQLVIEGLFGPVHQVTTTKELIDNETLSNFKIECLSIEYSEEEKKQCR